MATLTEKQKDFRKIVAAFNSGKYTPTQIGSLFRQYYVKHLKNIDVEEDLKFVPTQDVSAFDGKLPLGDLDS